MRTESANAGITHRTPRRFSRRGIHIVEVSMAMILLSSLLLVVLAFNHQLRGVRQDVLQRAVVLQQASNLLERCEAMPMEQLQSGSLPPVAELMQGSTAPHGVEYQIDISAGDEGAIRVTVIAMWDREAGPPRRPIALSMWKHPSN